MILNSINSDDYVYLKLTEDTSLPYGYFKLKAGTVVRFHIATLRQNLWKREARENLFIQETDSKTFYYLETEPNNAVSSTELLPTKLYNKVTVKKDLDIILSVKYGDLIVMNDWLREKLSEEVPFIRPQIAFMDYWNVAHFNSDFFKYGTLISNPSSKQLIPLGYNCEVKQYQFSEVAFPSTTAGKIICKDGDSICLQFKKGEEIDFSNPAVSLLFLNQEYIRFLLKTEVLPEQEKIKYFIADFQGWIPQANRKYYRIHDGINIKSLNDFVLKEVWDTIIKHAPDFNNVFYNNHNYSSYDNFDFDENGYLRYVWTSGGIETEHELSKIAEPVSREIGEEHYIHEVTMKELLEEERNLKYRAEEYFKSHKGRFYKLQKNNPSLDYIDFMIQEEKREYELKRGLVRKLTRVLKYKAKSETK